MSKNNNGEQVLNSMSDIQAVLYSVENDVMEALKNELYELPEYQSFQNGMANQVEAAELKTEEDRVLGEVGQGALIFQDMLTKLGKMQRIVLSNQAKVKSAVLADPGITIERSKFEGFFGKWLEKKVAETLAKSPAHSKLMSEMRSLVADANKQKAANEKAESRVAELRQVRQGLEKEAQSLLGSINL